ncbi:hypothetical protein AGMMS49579_24210 [Spirochaetia bacterium]|nr:hypothetical protein AGMMS49579_24210 [Spirochaetia bacterium]
MRRRYYRQKYAPWSKLQREVYNLVAPCLAFQLHCAAYRMDSQRGTTDLPRYWITFQGKIVWDYPKDFMNEIIDYEQIYGTKLVGENVFSLKETYPYVCHISAISDLIQEYIATPKEVLFDKVFENDKWGLTDILKSVDRRIGKRRLTRLGEKQKNSVVGKIIAERLGTVTG